MSYYVIILASVLRGVVEVVGPFAFESDATEFFERMDRRGLDGVVLPMTKPD